jgi:hypothetical protein
VDYLPRDVCCVAFAGLPVAEAISWKESVALWWSSVWRLALLALPCVIVIGLAAAPIADALGEPDHHTTIALWSGRLMWFPCSLFSMKAALRRRHEILQVSSESITWSVTLSIWWSMLWRGLIYASLTGLLVGIAVSLFVGPTSQHPGYLVVVYVIALGPLSIFSLKQGVEAMRGVGRKSS